MIGDKLSGQTLSHRSIVLSSRTISSDYVDKFVLITKWSWHSVGSNFQGNYKAALPPIPIMIKAWCGVAARISNCAQTTTRKAVKRVDHGEGSKNWEQHPIGERSRGRGRWWSPQMGRDPHFRSWSHERSTDRVTNRRTVEHKPWENCQVDDRIEVVFSWICSTSALVSGITTSSNGRRSGRRMMTVLLFNFFASLI